MMLDTAQYKDNLEKNRPRLDGEINPGTLEWVKKCSDLTKMKISIISKHILRNIIELLCITTQFSVF